MESFDSIGGVDRFFAWIYRAGNRQLDGPSYAAKSRCRRDVFRRTYLGVRPSVVR